jgi:hypothetical protein
MMDSRHTTSGLFSSSARHGLGVVLATVMDSSQQLVTGASNTAYLHLSQIVRNRGDCFNDDVQSESYRTPPHSSQTVRKLGSATTSISIT